MSFIGRVFGKNKIDCPRCLGKGNVDWEDIKRLNKELKWGPGKCAYCNGRGEVNSSLKNKIPVDTTYLTTDLNKDERNRIINGEENAVLRGILFDKNADNFINQVNFLKLKGNLSIEEITEFYLIPDNKMSTEEKDELMDYIKRIIEFNNKSKN